MSMDDQAEATPSPDPADLPATLDKLHDLLVAKRDEAMRVHHELCDYEAKVRELAELLGRLEVEGKAIRNEMTTRILQASPGPDIDPLEFALSTAPLWMVRSDRRMYSVVASSDGDPPSSQDDWIRSILFGVGLAVIDLG